jgi:tRNA dimethylallyltransferase
VIKLVRAPADRGVLHQRIEQRLRAMVAQGLVEEVERLWARGDLSADLPSMRCVGYRQVLPYLAGDYDREEMTLRAIYATRQLAKRQFTWLRAETGCRWIPDTPDPLDAALRAIDAALGR